MATFDLALSGVRDGSPHLPSADRIDQLARDANHHFRDTTLTPGKTLRLFAQQIAHGNVSCWAVRHLADEQFTDSAWCQARGRLPIELIETVHRTVIDEARTQLDQNDDATGTDRWRGHRLYVMDGTSDSMPDTPPLRAHYGVPSGCRPGLGFPTSHLLVMMDHRSGLLIDCLDSPLTTSDTSQAPLLHERLHPGDIVLGDDAFSGWGHLALILQANLHAIAPLHHRRTVDFTAKRRHARPRKKKSKSARRRSAKTKTPLKLSSRVIKSLGKDDQLVEYFKPQKPAWMSDEQWATMPESITVREIRRTIRRHGFRPLTVTIVTTLLDPQAYPADELIDLRLTRWMIETNIRHLKITLGMDVLKCKTLQGVRKERLMFLLVYNLIRIVMLHAARKQEVNVNRLSFADTLAWLRWGNLEQCTSLVINPLRPGRLEPRALKRQKKEFPYMTSSRADLKAQLRAKHCDTA